MSSLFIHWPICFNNNAITMWAKNIIFYQAIHKSFDRISSIFLAMRALNFVFAIHFYSFYYYFILMYSLFISSANSIPGLSLIPLFSSNSFRYFTAHS